MSISSLSLKGNGINEKLYLHGVAINRIKWGAIKGGRERGGK